MYISGFVEETIVDGLGIRDTIYVSGCEHNCKGCHNPETHDFKYGRELTEDYKQELITKITTNNIIDGVTFSGGDPLAIQNRDEVADFLSEIKRLRPDLNIWIYTGFTFEHLIHVMAISKCLLGEGNSVLLRIFKYCDVLVDGPFIEDLRNPDLSFKGSSNQKVIDVKKSLEKGLIVELKLD